MSRLNLYLIKGILKNGDTLSRSIIQSKLSGTENKFRVLHYIVTAKSTDDALQIQIPYSRIGSDWDSEYFAESRECICLCKFSEVSERNWPSFRSNGDEFIYRNELESIGYNSLEKSYQVSNKLDYTTIMEYLKGFSQILSVEFIQKINYRGETRFINETLIFPPSYGSVYIDIIKDIDFID